MVRSSFIRGGGSNETPFPAARKATNPAAVITFAAVAPNVIEMFSPPLTTTDEMVVGALLAPYTA